MAGAIGALRVAASRREVAYVDFPAQYAEEKPLIHTCVEEVFARGEFIGGPRIEELEVAVAAYCGLGHAVAVNSGTDALIFALKAAGIGPGDEVITPPNSFIASTAAIVHVGARPVFADVLPDQNIDPDAVAAAITPRTRAIMPVHLTGRIAEMPAILALAERHGLEVIEDAAQAIGSWYGERMSGAFGRIGCFSTHPLKNLNAAGDGGILVTDDSEAAARVRRLRNHGLVDRNTAAEWGYVSRMDNLQAAILLLRLKRLPTVIKRRRRNARLYRRLLDPAHVFVPAERPGAFDSYHTFVVQVAERDALQRHLNGAGIGTAVHYPVPIHLQPAARGLGHRRGDFPVAEAQAERILSLPIHQFLSDEDVTYVAETINAFYA